MYKILFKVLIISAAGGLCFSACPLDHFEIGCNADGIFGTVDDNELFVDCSQIYRHSDPAHNEDSTWLYWRYPLYYSVIYHNYYIGEPGFDTIKADDPNRCLSGTPNVDYDIIVEVISISSGLTAGSVDVSPAFTLANTGDSFNHSIYSDPHLHIKYRASTNTKLYWVTFQIYDAKGQYEPSQPISVVFVQDPPAGDLAVDGVVDIYDLAEFCYYWLEDSGGRANDYYERADANKDSAVDFSDFTLLAENWLH